METKLFDLLPEVVGKVIRDKKAFLQEQFGDASDYGIEGIVVVGSVAAGQERPDSDVDLYILSHRPGFEDDFSDELSKKLNRTVDHIGTIRKEASTQYTADHWMRDNVNSGFPQNGPSKIILLRDIGESHLSHTAGP